MPAVQSVHDRAIAHLYTAHHGWLLGWLRRRIGNGWDAADLAQDTFVRLLAAPDATPEKQRGWQLDEPRAYLALVAKRLLVNLHRRRALEQAYLETLARLPESLAPSPEQRALLLEAPRAAPPHAAIAARLGRSERTVKCYMVQAMACCIVHLP
jgi:RNA polymerase sigma-70 factor (ECF subfamily)